MKSKHRGKLIVLCAVIIVAALVCTVLIINADTNAVDGIIQISCGNAHSAALSSDGTVWVGGSNIYGQLGNGDAAPERLPAQVNNLDNVKQIACGDFYTVALKEDGTVWSVGYNMDGELGGKYSDDWSFDKAVKAEVHRIS